MAGASCYWRVQGAGQISAVALHRGQVTGIWLSSGDAEHGGRTAWSAAVRPWVWQVDVQRLAGKKDVPVPGTRFQGYRASGATRITPEKWLEVRAALTDACTRFETLIAGISPRAMATAEWC